MKPILEEVTLDGGVILEGGVYIFDCLQGGCILEGGYNGEYTVCF